MVGMIGKLTAKTSVLAIATIAAGALCVNSMKDNNLKEENQVQTEQTENPQNREIPMPWVYGTLSALGLLGTIRSGKKLQYEKHVQSKADEYNISVDMYKKLTNLKYGAEGDVHDVYPEPITLGLELYAEGGTYNEILYRLSRLEERIEKYKNEYPQLNILNDNQEKELKECIAELRSKANNKERITDEDIEKLTYLITHNINQDFPLAFYWI